MAGTTDVGTAWHLAHRTGLPSEAQNWQCNVVWMHSMASFCAEEPLPVAMAKQLGSISLRVFAEQIHRRDCNTALAIVAH